ncbi:MAG: multidrug effflux MFS transporter [Pseudomonadota bacterium]
MRAAQTPPALITLVLLTGFSPLSLNMFMPSLAGIAADLQTDYATIAWAVSGYLAVTAVIQLCIGPLSDRVGRRPLLLVATALFACASVGCVVAQDATTFLVFRMLQGGMTAGYTLSMAIVRDTRSEREAVSLIGYIGMSMALAPMLGPMLGGFLDVAFGWRSVFVFYAVSGFLLFGLCWMDLGETKPARASLSPGDPFEALALLRAPLFWAYALCGAFSIGVFYIFLTGAPLVAQTRFGLTTGQLGVYIGTITVGFMLGGFLSGRFGKNFSSAQLMLGGRVVALFGLVLGLILLFSRDVSAPVFFACTCFAGLGNGLTVPGSSAGAMSVRPDLAGSAAGLSGAIVVGMGAILTAITGAMIGPEKGAEMLLMLMLSAAGLGFLLALWAVHLTRARAA